MDDVARVAFSWGVGARHSMALLATPEALDGGSDQGRRRLSGWSNNRPATKPMVLHPLGLWVGSTVLLALFKLRSITMAIYYQ